MIREWYKVHDKINNPAESRDIQSRDETKMINRKNTKNGEIKETLLKLKKQV